MSFYNDINFVTSVTGIKSTFAVYNVTVNAPVPGTEYTIPNFTFERHMGRYYVQRVTWRTISYTGGNSDRNFRMRDSITGAARDIHADTGTTWSGAVLSRPGGYWTPSNLPTTGAAWFSPGAAILIRDGGGGITNTVHNISISFFGYYLGQ